MNILYFIKFMVKFCYINDVFLNRNYAINEFEKNIYLNDIRNSLSDNITMFVW